AVLTETLKVSRRKPHGMEKTHFTIFPEYSIPGLEGVNLIDTALIASEWPTGTIVIGGVDALSKADFTALANDPQSHFDTQYNSLDRIGVNEWVNCGVIWAKGADGKVERWLQPKLSPARPEMDLPYQDMFQGKSIFVFEGQLTD